MNILVIQSTDSGVYYHRQYTPHFTWRESGDEFEKDLVAIVESHHIGTEQLLQLINNTQFDIIQYSVGIITDPKLPKLIDFLRARDKAQVILDIDDRYQRLRKDVFKSIREADALTTTCDFLGSYYKKEGKKDSYVIENGIDSKEAQWTPTPMPEQLIFGYLGSTRHEDDLKEMRYDFSTRYLYTVCEEYKNILNVNWFGGLGHWSNYANHYDRVSVSLAPIKNTEFNKSKSLLKIVEAGMKKRAIICSKMEPYNRDESLFPAIDLVPKKKSWKEVVERYTLEEATQRGEELYKLVQPYEVRNLNKKRREIYLDILKKR